MEMKLTKKILLDYIFNSLDKEEDQNVTKFLIENPDYQEAVEGLMKLCIDDKLDRDGLEQHLDNIKFKTFDAINKPEIMIIQDKSGSGFIKKMSKFVYYVTAACFLGIFVTIWLFYNERKKSNILRSKNETLILQNEQLLNTDLAFDTLRININSYNTIKDTLSLIENNKVLKKDEQEKNDYRRIAKAFIPNRELEEQILAMNQERSEYAITYPSENAVFKKGEKVVFEWKNIENVTKFTLKNNDGNNIDLIKNPKSGEVIFTNLQSGLYYWQIESSRNILFLGKLYIDLD